MVMRALPAIVLALALTSVAPTLANAADPEPANESEDVVSVDGGSVGSTGRAAVNAAAGNFNQQANVAVIAIGDTALSSGLVAQITDADAATPSARKSATITGDAFANSSGLIAVNVTAGSANQQANLAVIGIGIEGLVVTDLTLSQARASQSPSGQSDETIAPEIVTGISSGAFAGSAGLVQVSLVGGERNSSANTFVLNASGGTNP